jgi:hypothetical protein
VLNPNVVVIEEIVEEESFENLDQGADARNMKS